MILNKYELKKLHHQRNMMLTNVANNYNTSNSHLATSNTNNCYNRQRTLLNHHHHNHHHNTYRLNHQLSSGYNSENHSNSSNSTTATSNYQINLSNTTTTTNSPQNTNNTLNFYRLSLSHLPLHHTSFLGPQCTCGAKNNNMDHTFNGDISMSSTRSNLNKHNKNTSAQAPNASSPILKNTSIEHDANAEEDDDDDEDDEDEDLDDEEDEEDDDIEEDIDEDENDEMINRVDDDESLNVDQKSLNILTSSLNLNTNNNNNNNNRNSAQNFANSINLANVNVNRNYKIIKTPVAAAAAATTTTTNIDSNSNSVVRLSTQLQRAPGTSSCHHTARIDLRRVRSFRDLTQRQLIFTPHDFFLEEKLGEGFFANVKKIISKHSGQEMVLKELKLSCVPPPPPPPMSEPSSESTTPKLDLLLNYTELNAAHKSFLKEAQVLRNLSHPNVIKFMGIMFTKEKHLNLILEYISGGTLKDIIHNIANVLPWKLRVGYAQDIAAAMEYLHSLNIIHRDLKSDNCLVRENGRTVVVADFGLSRICNYSNSNSNKNCNSNSAAVKTNNNSSLYFDSATSSSSLIKIQNSLQMSQSPQSSSSATNSFIVAAKRKLKRRGDQHQQRKQQRYAVVGNSFSMAPEMLKHQIYDERVDIFSFGIICCEIIGRVQADPDYLPRTSDFGLNVELFRKKYCEADCPKHFIKIAIACCELEPEKRPPFSKTHLWLETILSHLEANNPIPKNLLKNILDQNNTKRPISSILLTTPTNNNAPVMSNDLLNQPKT
jgi:serine/threonine protein kinase